VTPATGNGSGQITLRASAAGLPTGAYRAVLSIQSPDATPAGASIAVTLVVGTAAGMSIVGMRNNASGTVAFAPGMQAAVYGVQLAPSVQSAGRLPLPLSLAGVSATVNGITAPLYVVSSGQINLQIPYEVGQGPAVLAVNNNGRIAAFPFTVSVAAPGLYAALIDNNTFTFNSGHSGDVITAFLTGTGDLNPSLATGATPSASTPFPNLPRPRLPVGLTVGGLPAQIAFVGNASGLAGAVQINFTIPSGLGPGTQQVVVTVGDITSAPQDFKVLP
jgi:uncharacterized protein (TIGR03437 family)